MLVHGIERVDEIKTWAVPYRANSSDTARGSRIQSKESGLIRGVNHLMSEIHPDDALKLLRDANNDQ